MKLKARLLDIQAGGRRIAILDDETASLLGVHSSDRLKITYKNEHLIAIVNIGSNFPRNYVGLYEEISRKLREIIEAQGGNPKIRPEDIRVGEKKRK